MTAERTLRVGIDGRILALRQLRGLTRYTTCLLRALSRRDDVELHLFSPEDLDVSHLVDISASISIIPGHRELRWAAFELPRAIKRSGIDVFHAPADRGLPLGHPVPLVVTVHGSLERAAWRSLQQGVRNRAWYWLNEAEHWLFADRIITVSRFTADELVSGHVARHNQIRVVRPAAAPEFTPEPHASDDDVRQAAGIVRPYVLYVGGYDRHKNVDVVVEAFEHLDRSAIDLVVVADPQHRSEALRARWSVLPCADRIHLLTGGAHELPALYRGAELAVVPSYWESFSFPAVEAMACGTPLIASTAKALPETTGTAARFFDPTSPADLRREMVAILDDPLEGARRRAASLARAAAFDWDDAAAETVAVYRELASGS